MASDPSQIIMGLLQTAGLGSTPNSVAQQNIALRNGQQQNQIGALQIASAQQAAQREQQYTTDLNAYYAHPTTAALAQLAARYPDHAEALKQSYTMMDADKRSSDQTAFGSLFNAAQSGRADLAVRLLQQRQAAERQAGHDTSEIDDLLTSLGSPDPAAKAQALKQLQGFSQIHLAAADPSKFADVFGALGKGGAGEDYTLKPGETRFHNGQAIATIAPKDDWIWDSEGGNWVKRPSSGDAVTTGGGGQTSGGATGGPSPVAPVPRSPAARVAQLSDIWGSVAPGSRVTSGLRTPAEQADLRRRGVTYTTNSGHLDGTAIDVPIVPGQTPETIRAAYAAQGVPVRVIQESGSGPGQGTGPHFHIQRLAQPAAPVAQNSNPNIIHVRDPKPTQAPSGYRWKGANLEPIPGGPADSIALTPDAITSMAGQYLAGDKTVMQGLGRGQQGSANIARVRAEIAKQAHDLGLSGRDIAARMADFAGVVSGERAAGTRIAQIELAATEAEKIIPLALSASDALPRSGFVPFARAQQMVQSGTNDPKLRQFVTANQALVNVYSRAVSPTGAPTVSDKEHARELLSTAYDQESYRAVVYQMKKEIAAARAAPHDVRGALYGSVGGMGGPPAPSGFRVLRVRPK